MAIYTPSSEDSLESSGKLKIAYFSNEYPVDDPQELYRRLHQHSKDRRHPLLDRLFDEADGAVRAEIERLPTELKSIIPPFESITTLVEYPELRKGRLGGSIDGVILCVLQIATYLG